MKKDVKESSINNDSLTSFFYSNLLFNDSWWISKENCEEDNN